MPTSALIAVTLDPSAHDWLLMNAWSIVVMRAAVMMAAGWDNQQIQTSNKVFIIL